MVINDTPTFPLALVPLNLLAQSQAARYITVATATVGHGPFTCVYRLYVCRLITLGKGVHTGLGSGDLGRTPHAF
jgi:hypothetical protein